MNLDTSLTIGELARRTDLPVATLRAWERRHGYPQPFRLPSGHRRYDEAAVSVLRQAAERRRAGMPVAQALERSGARPSSAVHSVRSLLGGLRPAIVPVPSLLAVSRAIEDAAAEQRGPTLLIGAFQRPRIWQRSSRRWRRIADATLVTLALAPGLRRRAEGPLWTAPIPPELELADEWAVICDGPRVSACVVACEHASTVHRPDRRFEAVWSTDPHVVRHVARSVWTLVRPTGPPDITRAVEARLSRIVEPDGDAPGSSTELTTDVLARLGGRP